MKCEFGSTQAEHIAIFQWVSGLNNVGVRGLLFTFGEGRQEKGEGFRYELNK